KRRHCALSRCSLGKRLSQSFAPDLAVAEINDLLLGIAEKLPKALLPTNAGVLETTVRYTGEVRANPIDPNVACIHGLRHSQCAGDVLSPHSTGETEIYGIGLLDRFRFRLETHDRHDRAKDLFPRDPHLWQHFTEYRRLNPIPFVELLALHAPAAD